MTTPSLAFVPRTVALGASLVLVLLLGHAAAEEPYLIGPEDVLSISVWEHPELAMTGPVNQVGNIVLPPIGDVRAAGRTPESLARHLEDVLETFLRQRVQATVSILAYNSRRVHVTGDVRTPGRYSFATIPHILEVLGSAGGPNPTADLAHVKVLRTSEVETTAVAVNLDEALQTGNLSSLPKLAIGDVIYVPSKGQEAAVLMPGEMGIAYVLGAVGAPGPVRVGDGLALTRLMAIVGGFRADANTREVRIMAQGQEEGGSWVLEADLADLLETGNVGPSVRPGELVYVPSKDPSAIGSARGLLDLVAGASRDVLNLFLLRDFIREE